MTDTTTRTDPLVILSLKAENFKRLRAIEITPDGEMVVLNGKNRQGKTSILDAMWGLFAGDGVVQSDPIRHGEETAIVTGEVGPSGGPAKYVVTRKFRTANPKLDPETKEPIKGGKKYTTEVIVASPDGARFPSAQKVLDGIMGKYSFDPKLFVDMDDTAKVTVLKRFVPSFDFDANLRVINTAMEDRKVAKRKAKELHAQANGIVLPADVPEKPIDEDAIVAEMQKAGEHNAELVARVGARERAAERIVALQAEAAQKAAEADRKRIEADAIEAAGVALMKDADDLQVKLKAAPELPEPIDVTAITAQIAQARASNDLFAKSQAKTKLIHEAANHDQSEILLDTKIEEARKAATDAIAAADMPVKGLAFTEDGVMLNGVPFNQASDEEQLSASVRIAAAMHPQLGVIRIRDGSLLDTESRALLAQFARDQKLQIWMEVVDEGSEVGIVIEDGSIKAAPEADGE